MTRNSAANQCGKFAKSHAMSACMPTWYTCQHACMVCMPTCLCASMVYVPTCQKQANFSFLHANVTNVSTWHANVPKGMPIFRTFLWWNDKGNFYTLLLCKKFYIVLDIIVIHIICICITYKNCFIPPFYTSCHNKEKSVGFFFFIVSFLFCSLLLRAL